MDKWFTFFLHPGSSESSALQELSSCLLQHASFEEDLQTGDCKIYAVAEESLFPGQFQHIASYQKLETSEINWDQEWSSFSPYFQDGVAKIPLSDFSPSQKEITLLPGPGFGDLSHPTTLLSLQLLASHAKGQTVIDLGCGSGILGIAALQWEATFVYALDIDPKALDHTKENAKLNHLENSIITAQSLPKTPNQIPTLLVINMTFAEQKLALASISEKPKLWITSGILKQQQKTYLRWIHKQGLKLETLVEQDQWIACLLKR
ncbi:MAG: 50S ribosomal protein L11 methyltransferase [Rhabdochlamydiaceae bacterium]|nr:50S ribosomal protein L11 methyltransferase [Rhabdochlamydiaceae bacterium]